MKGVDIKLNFDSKGLKNKIVDFFVHKASVIIILIGFIFLGYVVYMWYYNVYSYEWDEVKKQEYMNNKNAGTNLNRVKLEKVLKDIERRKEEYAKNIDEVKDIFRLGQQ